MMMEFETTRQLRRYVLERVSSYGCLSAKMSACSTFGLRLNSTILSAGAEVSQRQVSWQTSLFPKAQAEPVVLESRNSSCIFLSVAHPFLGGSASVDLYQIGRAVFADVPCPFGCCTQRGFTTDSIVIACCCQPCSRAVPVRRLSNAKRALACASRSGRPLLPIAGAFESMVMGRKINNITPLFQQTTCF